MPNYSNLGEFLKQQIRNFGNARQANQVLREAAVTTVPEIKRRIQNEGKRSDNQTMKTKSPKSFGAYSYAYGKKRQKKGRQTAIVDITDTGAMMTDLKAGPVGNNGYGIGFPSRDAEQKAEWNEKNFGVIFDLNDLEMKLSLATINAAATKILSR
jgi:hypothetical protein